MFGFLLERLFLRYPKESVFYVCDREEEKVCLCVFLSASISVCMWVSCLPPAGAITYLSVCQWNTVSLKEDNLDGTHSSQPGTYRSSIPQPPPTTNPSSNPTRRLPPPHWAPLCHLKPMHTTRGIFNSRHVHECQCSEISQLCAFFSFYLVFLSHPSGPQTHTGSVWENDPPGRTESLSVDFSRNSKALYALNETLAMLQLSYLNVRGRVKWS